MPAETFFCFTSLRTGGTTAGGTTAGGTTAGGSTSGGTGATNCYFISSQTTSKGGATAINPPTQQLPANGATLAVAQPFTFSSVVTLDAITAEYVLQISQQPGFPKGSKTITYPVLVSASTGTLSITGDPSVIFPGFAQPLWWRVGAKNIADSPGPLKDPATGLRYVFSPARSFTRTIIPPGPPGG